MKKITLLLAILVAFVVSACSSTATPEGVAEKYTIAVYTADFETAKEYSNEKSKPMVDFIAGMVSKAIEPMKASSPSFEVVAVEVAEDGNTAVVEAKILNAVEFEDSNFATAESQDIEVQLTNEDGKWLVDSGK